jgi:COMPASS component SWD3
LSGKLWKTLKGHHNAVYCVSYSPRGTIIASGSYDEAVRLWDVRSGRCLKTLPAHSDPVSGVGFNRDGTIVVSCSHDGLIRIWDVSTGQCLRTMVEEGNVPVASVRFAPNGRYLLAGTLDSCVRLWDYVQGKTLKTYQDHRNEKWAVQAEFVVHKGRRLVMCGSEDSDVFLWDVNSKEPVQILVGHEDVVLGCSAHPTEKVLATGGLDKTVKIWVDES